MTLYFVMKIWYRHYQIKTWSTRSGNEACKSLSFHSIFKVSFFASNTGDLSTSEQQATLQWWLDSVQGIAPEDAQGRRLYILAQKHSE